MRARRSELSSFGASTGRSSRRYGPRTRAPSARGLVGGLRPWDLPSGRHPSYAASIFYRLEIFTLWIHGYLQASHNHSERALRHIASGRRSWLFFGSDVHATAAANIFSLIASCQLHDIDAEAYLAAIIRVLPHWPRDRYIELAPKYWLRTRARLDPEELKLPLGRLTVPPPLSAEQQPAPN